MKNRPLIAILLLFAASIFILSCGDDVKNPAADDNGPDEGYSLGTGPSPDDTGDEYDYLSLVSYGDPGSGTEAGADTPPIKGKKFTYTLSWSANREKAVNSPGGGYIIYISSRKNCPPEKAARQKVPCTSGDRAPTQADISLAPGTWYIKIAGYSAFNGGTEGVPSDEIAVHAGEE